MAKVKDKKTTAPDEQDVVAKNDAYTGMLMISLIALLIGCVLLFLDYQRYEGKGPPRVQQVQSQSSMPPPNQGGGQPQPPGGGQPQPPGGGQPQPPGGGQPQPPMQPKGMPNPPGQVPPN